MKTPDQDILVLIRALEDARRILREFIEPGPSDPMRTVERLLILLDRNDAVHSAMTTWKTRNASQRPSRPGNPETSASLSGSAFDRPVARGESSRGQLALSQLWPHCSAELACCYMDGDSTSSRHDEAARRKVSFQDAPASGPGQATSATRRHDRIET